MKVAFYVYPIAFQSPGGGEILLLKTREYLEKAGQPVTLFDPWRDKLKDFDILHTFGSVKDCLRVMETAKTAGCRNVLSTICWYSWKSAWGTHGSPVSRAAAVARHAAKCFLPFLPSERKRMMQVADRVIPNSQSEAEQLKRFFQVPASKMVTIPNAVDKSFAEASPDMFQKAYGLKDFVLIVGRIEPRKNQLNVVRALKGTGRTVVFIGEPVLAYKAYYEACRREADANMHFLGGLPHESGLLASAYAACHTFLLATWLETPGLAALEAGLAGARVVITQEGATREYFQDLALYVRPDSPEDIRARVLAAAAMPRDGRLKEHLLAHYLWPAVAEKTLRVYRELAQVQHA